MAYPPELQFGHDFARSRVAVLVDFLNLYSVVFPPSAGKDELVRRCDEFAVDWRARNHDLDGDATEEDEDATLMTGQAAANLTAPKLRQLLLKHGVDFPLSCRKPELVTKLDDHIGRVRQSSRSRTGYSTTPKPHEVVYSIEPRHDSGASDFVGQRTRSRSASVSAPTHLPKALTPTLAQRRSFSRQCQDDSAEKSPAQQTLEELLIRTAGLSIGHIARGERRQAAEMLRSFGNMLDSLDD